MTWYCWNHWFWITVIFVLTFCSVYSYPVSPIEEIKEYNNKELPLKYPINLPSNDDHDIDDIYMGQQNIPLLSEDNIKKIIIEQNKNQLIEKNNNEKLNKNNNNKTIEDNLILNKNQINNKNNSNLNNISNVIKLVPDTTTNLNDKLKINNNENVSENINKTTVTEIETENTNLKNDSNFSIISTNNNKTLQNIHLNESADSTQSNIMQIKKNINSTILSPPPSLLLPPSLQSQQIFVENNNESTTTTTIFFDNSTASNYSDDDDDDNDEIGNITKLDLVITTINSTIDNSTESNEKISTKLENVTKMINDSNDNGNINEPEYIRKSKGLLSSEYRDGSRSINFPTESKNLLTRSAAVSSDLQLLANEQQQHEDGGNVSSEALQITGVMDAGTISGICFSVFALCIGVSMFGIIIYRRRFLNKPQTLNEPDSSVYIDDSTIRDNSDEMYSLDNDSFLNSLEAMTIQNYWTDTVKHTKL